MEWILLCCLFLLQALSLVGTAYLLIRHPLNPALIVLALSLVLIVVPGWAWILGYQELFPYAFGTQLAVEAEISAHAGLRGLNGFVVITLSCVAMLLGTWLGHLGTSRRTVLQEISVHERRFSGGLRVSTAVIWTMGVAWVGLWLYTWQRSGQDLLQFLSPDYEGRDVFASYIDRTFVGLCPAAIYAILYFRSRRFTMGCFCWCIAMLCATLPTAQRRDLVTVFIFAAMFTTLVGHTNIQDAIRANSRRLVGTAIVAGLLPLGLWFSRVFATRFFGRGEIIEVSDLRGPVEVVFGSGATGLPSVFLVQNYMDRHGPLWGEAFVYSLTNAIPRSIWPDKPINFDVVLQEKYGYEANPSIFWIGDLLISFGAFYPIGALLLGFVISKLYRHFGSSLTPSRLVFVAAAIAYSPTLFKNGVGQFLIGWTYLCLLGAGLMWLCFSHRTSERPSAV